MPCCGNSKEKWRRSRRLLSWRGSKHHRRSNKAAGRGAASPARRTSRRGASSRCTSGTGASWVRVPGPALGNRHGQELEAGWWLSSPESNWSVIFAASSILVRAMALDATLTRSIGGPTRCCGSTHPATPGRGISRGGIIAGFSPSSLSRNRRLPGGGGLCLKRSCWRASASTCLIMCRATRHHRHCRSGARRALARRFARRPSRSSTSPCCRGHSCATSSACAH